MGVGVIAFLIVIKIVPSQLDQIKHDSLRSFDWPGAVLLAAAMISLLLYLSSRSVAGVPPLWDWRLHPHCHADGLFSMAEQTYEKGEK